MLRVKVQRVKRLVFGGKVTRRRRDSVAILGMLNEGKGRGDLLNACLALQPPHILHDLIDIPRSDAFDLRHVAELPMVRPDAVGRRQLEGLIPVMVWLIDLIYERRSVVGSYRLFPMTGRTVRVECGFAHLELCRHGTTPSGLFGLRGIAGSEEAKAQQPHSDLKSFRLRDIHGISIAGPGYS